MSKNIWVPMQKPKVHQDMLTPADMRKAVFLDRDGTLNEDLGYVYRPEDWHWLPGVIETLRRLHAWGFVLVVVSNQSGIARGLYTLDDLHALEQWVASELIAQGACIDAWYACPHLPEITGTCTCRKPNPGLLLQAAHDLHIDLAHSWMVGDKVRDVLAGIAAGCQCILLRPAGQTSEQDSPVPKNVSIVPHLAAAGIRIMEAARARTRRPW